MDKTIGQKIGFDNDKYIRIQSENIKERIAKFSGKLYLELGGKLFDDHHASRVLPGFQPDSKLRMFQKISDQIEIVIVISAEDIEKNKELDEIHRRDTLAWFHYGCYFNVGNQKRLQFTLQQMANSPQGLTEPLAYSVQMEMTIAGRNNLLALTSYEWLCKICRNMPTHKLWEDEEFRKKAIELHEKADHEKAIHDYNLLKAKGYEDKFIFLEDVKTLKEFLKEIEFELPKDIRFPQKYEKGIILSGSPYTGINISFGLAHCIASPENPYYVQERAETDSFGIISGNGLPFPYEIVCKLIENNLIPDANIFTSQYVKEEGLKITQANLQFLADYYLMGRKDKDLSPKELW